MSYRRHALGAFASGDSYPAGTPIVGGFQASGLASADSTVAIQRLREAVAASFPVGVVRSAGWGPAHGVGAGRMYVVIATSNDGVTGAQINSGLAAVASDLGRRLGRSVSLTNAHAIGGSAPLPSLTPDVDPTTGQVVQPMSPLVIGGIAVAGLVVAAGAMALFARRSR